MLTRNAILFSALALGACSSPSDSSPSGSASGEVQMAVSHLVLDSVPT